MPTLFVNDWPITDDEAKAETLNQTFIGKQLKPLQVNEPAPIIHSTACEELSNITFSTKATLKEVRNLDIYKASGPDVIPPIVLKTAAPELAVPFTRLFRKSPARVTFIL